MIKTNKGFTFVELLVVITIIGVLAGLLYLMMGPSGNMAKKKACFGNRATIMLALETYRYAEGKSKTSYSLQDFIDAEYEDTMSTENAKCPSNGIYSEGEENGREVVLCSVHYPTPGAGDTPGGGDEPPGGGPSGNIIPGTGDFGGDGYAAIDDWEETLYTNTSNQRSMIGFEKGQKFLYDDKYYIAVETLPEIDDQGNNNPDQDVWWTTKSGGGLIQFTGVSKDWDSDEIQTGYKFYRGDILYYNGDYYVCIAHKYTEVFEVIKGQWWSNTPDLPGSAWAWYKLSS